MKATDDFKMYLNSIINDIDADIHNELWNRLINVIEENEQLKLLDVGGVMKSSPIKEGWTKGNVKKSDGKGRQAPPPPKAVR